MNVSRVLLSRKLLTSIVLMSMTITLQAATPAEKLLKNADSWFESDEGRVILAHVLSWQTEHGDWPKNTDTTKEYQSTIKQAGTFDNGSTTGELRVLARASRITKDGIYKAAFIRGFDHILKAQYPNGGWPQYFPLSNGYHRQITFNDGSMIRLMQFLKDAATYEDFSFLDPDRRKAGLDAVDRGIDCILKCQVVINGKPTVWCAQHDAQTLVPTQARSYEHPSLSGAESAGILLFLINLEKPSPAVVRAIEAGVTWFEQTKITGYRYQKSKTELALTKDPDASPLWARFYELQTNTPIFSDRDGIVKYDLNEIGIERRGGYAWYGTWGENVIKAYAKWESKRR